MDLFLPQWSKLQSCPPFVAEDKENLHAWVIGKSFEIDKAAHRGLDAEMFFTLVKSISRLKLYRVRNSPPQEETEGGDPPNEASLNHFNPSQVQVASTFGFITSNPVFVKFGAIVMYPARWHGAALSLIGEPRVCAQHLKCRLIMR